MSDPWLGIAIAFAVAIVALGAELTLSRMWDRKHQMIGLLQDLNADLGHYLIHLSSIPGSPQASGPDFIRLQSQVLTTLDLARIIARFPLRNARKVRVEVQRLTGRVTAAWINYATGKKLSRREVVEGFSLLPLRHALLGDDGTLTAEANFYSANGFLDGNPKPSTRRERRRYTKG